MRRVLGADGVARLLLETVPARRQPGTVGKVAEVAVVRAVVQIGIPGLRGGETLREEEG